MPDKARDLQMCIVNLLDFYIENSEHETDLSAIGVVCSLGVWAVIWI